MGLCAHIDDDDFLATACLHKICLPRSMRNSKGSNNRISRQQTEKTERESGGER